MSVPRTIFVTGAGGLLGRHLVPLLEADGAGVIAPRRAELDLARPLDSARLPARLDAIVHLAQSDRFRDFPGGAADMFAVNTAATAALLDHARRAGAGMFVLASTGGVYATGGRLLGENAPLADPMPYYPASKRAAELVALAHGAELHVAVLRFFFMYGAGQKRDMLMPRLVDSVRNGREIKLDGEDGLRINPVHVGDAARATAAALRLTHSAIINVAGPQALSLRDIGEAIGKAVGRKPLFTTNDASTPASLLADTTRMDRLLGPATISFDNGIADLTR